MSARGLGLGMLLLAGCVHAPPAEVHPTARLVAVENSGEQANLVRLTARYQLDGVPIVGVLGREARLTVSLDDLPVAVAVVTPRTLAGDVVEVPLALALTRRPVPSEGGTVRVRLRGELELQWPSGEAKVPTDGEWAVTFGPPPAPPRR